MKMTLSLEASPPSGSIYRIGFGRQAPLRRFGLPWPSPICSTRRALRKRAALFSLWPSWHALPVIPNHDTEASRLAGVVQW
jgi:hypothetical protein